MVSLFEKQSEGKKIFMRLMNKVDFLAATKFWRKRWGYLIISVLIAVFLGTVFAKPPPQTKWVLQFSDEFNGEALNTEEWDYRIDKKRRSYQRSENVSVKDGNLVISLKREQFRDLNNTAGGVITKKEFMYGYYETRVQLPKAVGWHSAFWTMGCCQEIDGFEWNPAHVKWYVDDKLVRTTQFPLPHSPQKVWLTCIGEGREDDFLYFDYFRFYTKEDVELDKSGDAEKQVWQRLRLMDAASGKPIQKVKIGDQVKIELWMSLAENGQGQEREWVDIVVGMTESAASLLVIADTEQLPPAAKSPVHCLPTRSWRWLEGAIMVYNKRSDSVRTTILISRMHARERFPGQTLSAGLRLIATTTTCMC